MTGHQSRLKSRSLERIGSVLAFAAFGTAFALRGLSGHAAVAQDPLPDGPGKETTVKICGVCHEPQRVAAVRLTEDGWQSTVEDMIHRGAKGTDEEFKAVLNYLVTNFKGEAPRALNVNTAAAIDLESVAGLLRKEAAAVIEYREKNGKFKTLDDLKNVPGLDFKKIDAARDRLVAL
jgi:competence protein ComEA